MSTIKWSIFGGNNKWEIEEQEQEQEQEEQEQEQQEQLRTSTTTRTIKNNNNNDNKKEMNDFENWHFLQSSLPLKDGPRVSRSQAARGRSQGAPGGFAQHDDPQEEEEEWPVNTKSKKSSPPTVVLSFLLGKWYFW